MKYLKKKTFLPIFVQFTSNDCNCAYNMKITDDHQSKTLLIYLDEEIILYRQFS